MSDFLSDLQVLWLRTPCFHWITDEQFKMMWKLSDSSASTLNTLSHNLIKYKKLRLENLMWRLWYTHHKHAITNCTATRPKTLECPNQNTKFYLNDETDDLTEDNDDEEEDELDSWYSDEGESLFEKRTDYTALLSSETLEHPVSLLTQMLKQQNQSHQSKAHHDGLRRCQSRYRCLDEWFTSTRPSC